MPSRATTSSRSRSRAVVFKMAKGAVKKTVEILMCKMSPLSGCEGEAGRRDLCDSCYQSTYKDVKDGVYTWEEVEAAGYCSPPKRQLQKRLLRAILARRVS